MKKSLYLFLSFACIVLCSCNDRHNEPLQSEEQEPQAPTEDPRKVVVKDAGESVFAWQNNSTHPITLSLQTVWPIPDLQHLELSPIQIRDEFTVVLKPGESFFTASEYMGEPPGYFYNWIMTVSFGSDDAKLSITFAGDNFFEPTPAEYDKRFNVTYTENYTCLNPPEVPHIDPNYPFGCRWQYTFTDADYQAAVAYRAK